MPAFAFTARTPAGRTVKGLRVVADASALAPDLAAGGLFLIRARPAPPVRRPVTARPEDLATLLVHLAAYLEAGLPLLDALRDYREPRRPRLEAAVADLALRLSGGAALSEAMAAHPGLFQPVHLAMVQAGEGSGRLDQALRSVLRLVEGEAALRGHLRQAATYPLILLAVLGLVALLGATLSLPPILKVLAELGLPLPWGTRLFLAAGRALSHHGWLLAAATLVLGLGLGLGLRLALRHPAFQRSSFRLAWDGALLTLPALGPLLTRLALARFTRACAEQVRAGLPLARALALSAGVAGNARLIQSLHALRAGVEQGAGLAEMAGRSGLFPPLVLRLLAIGERTGKLEETLDRAAAHLATEVAKALRLSLQVLDPALKILLAALLLFVAAALLLPLYQLIGGLHA